MIGYYNFPGYEDKFKLAWWQIGFSHGEQYPPIIIGAESMPSDARDIYIGGRTAAIHLYHPEMGVQPDDLSPFREPLSNETIESLLVAGDQIVSSNIARSMAQEIKIRRQADKTWALSDHA